MGDMKKAPSRMGGGLTGVVMLTAIFAMGSLACTGAPPIVSEGGKCCIFTGPVAHDCAAIENLGPGADLDGRCNQVNGGQSCAWDYSVEECCETAANDGFGEVVDCPVDEGGSGECCVYTGPVGEDCAALENLGPGADLDGRCTQINQGQSCSWLYGIDECCQTAVGDGFPGSVVCP